MGNNTEDKNKPVNNTKRIHHKPVKHGEKVDHANNGGTSPNFILPNLVRIEQLDNVSRKRFLGGLKQVLDDVREKIRDNTEILTFFGYTTEENKVSMKLHADWQATMGNGVFSAVQGVSQMLPFAKGNNIISNATNVVTGIGAMAEDLLNINTSATGSTSVHDFKSIGINGFTISCSWYLPEQEAMFKQQIKTLVRMIYPQSLDTTSLASNLKKVTPTMLSGMGEVIKPTVNAGEVLAKDVLGDTVVEAGKDVGEAVGNVAGNLLNFDGSDKDSKTFEHLIDLYKAGADLFGAGIVLNPLPVRVTVGQYIDVEPMVIEDMDLSFSRELFINDSGRHIPLFANVNITLKFWLTPTPDKEFFKIIDTEMFGN